jgi:hypothetical protein
MGLKPKCSKHIPFQYIKERFNTKMLIPITNLRNQNKFSHFVYFCIGTLRNSHKSLCVLGYFELKYSLSIVHSVFECLCCNLGELIHS